MIPASFPFHLLTSCIGRWRLLGKSKTAIKKMQFQFVRINNWQHFNLQVHFMLLSSKFGIKIPRNDCLPIRELLAWKGKERKVLHVLFVFYQEKHQKDLFEFLHSFSTSSPNIFLGDLFERREQKLSSFTFPVNT